MRRSWPEKKECLYIEKNWNLSLRNSKMRDSPAFIMSAKSFRHPATLACTWGVERLAVELKVEHAGWGGLVERVLGTP